MSGLSGMFVVVVVVVVVVVDLAPCRSETTMTNAWREDIGAGRMISTIASILSILFVCVVSDARRELSV